MRRGFILPSEEINFVQHDCRPDDIKFKYRSQLYDVAVLSNCMSKTKSSLNSIIYPNYLSQPEDINKMSRLPSREGETLVAQNPKNLGNQENL